MTLKIKEFQDQVHQAAKIMGWWDNEEQKVFETLKETLDAEASVTHEELMDLVKILSEKGHLKQRSPLDCHMLMVSELAEATEEVRKRTPPYYVIDPHSASIINPPDMDLYYDVVMEPSIGNTGSGKELYRTILKPEGELIELADTVIRILDYCGSKGWDLEAAINTKFAYNQTRSYRHGNKAF